MTANQLILQFNCPVCDGSNENEEQFELNELIECADCGAEFEVTRLSPLELHEIDFDGEDWGQ